MSIRCSTILVIISFVYSLQVACIIRFDLMTDEYHNKSIKNSQLKLDYVIHGTMLIKGISNNNNGLLSNSYPFSNKYNEKLRALNDYRISSSHLDTIESLDNQINDVSKKILLIAKQDETTKLLMTIPGIGYYYSAILIISEIRDINRFPNSYHLCLYADLVPSTYSSGGLTYYGKITKTGSKYLRWIMLECVHAHIRTDKNSSNIARFYERLSKRKGAPKAAVAAASKLLRVVYVALP